MLLSHILTCLQYELLSGSVTGTGVIVPAFEFRGTKSTVRRRNPVRLLFPFSSTILPSLPGAEDRRCSRGAMVSEVSHVGDVLQPRMSSMIFAIKPDTDNDMAIKYRIMCRETR